MGHTAPHRTHTIGTALVGAVVGAVVGAIVAVNVVIFSGADRGYETSLPELFRENPVVAVVVSVILLAGPIVGATLALRRRSPQ